MDSSPGNEIKVAIRVRPLLQKEISAGLKKRWLCTSTKISPDSSQTSNSTYVFDRVFDENAKNLTVYEELASDIVKQAMIGFNGTLFTYGQSGSGKTYTIDALRTYAIKSAYDYIENCPSREFLMRVSYIELYNEKLMDLLARDSNTTLTVREDVERNVYIDGLQEIIVKSQDHVKDVLAQGNARRTFAETKLNERSSRAHCIFRLVIESRGREDPENSPIYVSYLYLVDLAGSERAGENNGERLREGVSINLSLLTLSQVIRKLSGEQKEFINYRDSKLTRILQNALEGNSKTAILCTVSPFSVEETHSTLRFALNAKKVKTKPQQNEVLTESALLKKSQLEISRLQKKIKELEERNLSQENEELQRKKEKIKNLMKEFTSILCVSSKAEEEKRMLDKKRRETVCVPQISRTTVMKAQMRPLPPLQPRMNFLCQSLNQVDSPIVPKSPQLNDSVFSGPHPIDSPCTSRECLCNDMSFTDFEQAIVHESVLQKCRAEIRKYKAENDELKKQLRLTSGRYVTRRGEFEQNECPGSAFLNPTFQEENDEKRGSEIPVKSEKEVLDEEIENIYLENENMKSQIIVYKQETQGLKGQLHTLTIKAAQQEKVVEEYERNMAKLHERVRNSEEEILKLRVTKEKLTSRFEEESKRWSDKMESMQWERITTEVVNNEKGLLELSSIDQNETIRGEQEESLERLKEEILKQRAEILKEWEEIGKLKEELNEQAEGLESRFLLMEENKDKINKEKDRLHKEWNYLEKAHNDFRWEKEEFYKEHKLAESSFKRSSIPDEANLQGCVKTVYNLKREGEQFISERVSAIEDHEESSRMLTISELAQDEFVQEMEGFCSGIEASKNIPTNQNKIEMSGMQETLQGNSENPQYTLSGLSEKVALNVEHKVHDEYVAEIRMLKDEKAKLLKELEVLKHFVSGLNKNKEALELMEGNFCQSQAYTEDNAEIQEETTIKSEGLLREMEALRRAQNDLKERELLLEEKEAAVEGELKNCCVHLEEIKRLQTEIDKYGEFQEDEGRDKEKLVISEGYNTSIVGGAGVLSDVEKADTLKEKAEEREVVLERQKAAIQEERDKLEKWQAELAEQEENVERKIEKLCMLEEEKELLEEEKSWLHREQESLRQAKKDYQREQEASRHKQPKTHEDMEQECKDNDTESCSKTTSSATKQETLQKEWEDLRRAQEELRQERELFENEAAERQERGLQNEQKLNCEDMNDRSFILSEETLAEKWRVLNQAENAFRREKEALEQEKLEWKKILEEKRNYELVHLSGYGSDGEISKDNVIYPCGLKESSVVVNSIYVEIQETKREKAAHVLNELNQSQDMNGEGSHTADFEGQLGMRAEKKKIFDEEWNSLQQEIQVSKPTKTDLSEDEEQLIEMEEKLLKTQEDDERLQREKERLDTERSILQREKERFEEEREMLEQAKTLLEQEKESLHSKWENLKDALDDQQKKEEELTEKEKEIEIKTECLLILDEERMRLQKEQENLKQAEEVLRQEQVLFSERKENHDNEREGLLKELENAKRDLEVLKQNRVDLTEKEDRHPDVGTVHLSQHSVLIEGGEDLTVYGRDEASKSKKSVEVQCDVIAGSEIMSFCGVESERKRLEEEQERLQEEWRKLKLAEEDLRKQQARYEDVFEEDQKTLQQNRNKPKGTEEKGGLEQEQLKEHHETSSCEKDELHELQEQLQLEKVKEETRIIQMEKGMLQNEKISFQEEKETFHFEKATFEEDKDRFLMEKNKFQEEKEKLDEEKLELQMVKEMIYDEKTIFEKEKERLVMEKEMFQGEKAVFEKEKNRCNLNKEMLLNEDVISEDVKERFYAEKSTHIGEAAVCEAKFLNEKAVFEEEKVRFLTENAVFEEEKERHHREKVIFENEKIKLNNEKAVFEEEKERVQDEQITFYQECEKLRMEKILLLEKKNELHREEEMLQEKASILQKEEEMLQEKTSNLQRGEEVLQEKTSDLQGREEMLQEKTSKLLKEEEMLQEKTGILQRQEEMLQEKTSKLLKEEEMLQEKTGILQRQEEMLQEKTSKLLKEEEMLQEKAGILQRQEEMLQEKTSKLLKEEEMLREKTGILQKQEEMLQEKASKLQREEEMLQEKMNKLQREEEMLQEKMNKLQREEEMLQEKTSKFQREEEMLQEKMNKLQREEEMLQEKTSKLQREEEMLQEKMNKLQREEEMLQEKMNKLQREEEMLHEKTSKLLKEEEMLQEKMNKLLKEEVMLQAEEAVFQEEKGRLQEHINVFHNQERMLEMEKELLQQEKELLQGDKETIQKEIESMQEKREILEKIEDDLRKRMDELTEKEASAEIRVKKLCDEERKKTEGERKSLEEARDEFSKEEAAFRESDKCLEEEKKHLEKEWENMRQCLSSIKQDKLILLEREKCLQEEEEGLASAWEDLKQSQDCLNRDRRALEQSSAEVEERLQVVLERERNVLDSEVRNEEQEDLDRIRELEDELEKAEGKNEYLESLIFKGKAVLAEKSEAIMEAHSKAKELQEEVCALKSTLAVQKSLLETKSDEYERLKKENGSYKVAVRELEELKKKMDDVARGRVRDKEYYEDVIRQMKLKLRDAQNVEMSFTEQSNLSSQSGQSVSQIRRMIEFENAAKFMELNDLRKAAEEHKAVVQRLEMEKSELQEECTKFQLLLSNEEVRWEAMRSTANQTVLARRRVEEELMQLRKQLDKGADQSRDESSADEVTKMLKNQLKEKDEMINQLSKTLDTRNMRWNAVAIRHKELIEENHNSKKTVAKLKEANAHFTKLQEEWNKLSEESMESKRLRQEVADMRLLQQSDFAEMTRLQKENAEIKALLEKLKTELVEQKQQMEQAENLQRQSQQEALQPPSHEQSKQQGRRHHSQGEEVLLPACRSGGAVESFVIAVKDREIRDLRKKVERQTEALRQLEQNAERSSRQTQGCGTKQPTEEQRHKRYLENSKDKENLLPTHH